MLTPAQTLPWFPTGFGHSRVLLGCPIGWTAPASHFLLLFLFFPFHSNYYAAVAFTPSCSTQSPHPRHRAFEGASSLSGPRGAPDMHTAAFHRAQVPCSSWQCPEGMWAPILGRPHFGDNPNTGGLSSLCSHSLVSLSVLGSKLSEGRGPPALFSSVSSTP